MPTHIDGGSALEGFEIGAMRRLNLYFYAGWVYGARPRCNRVVSEYTAGGDRTPVPSLHAVVSLGLQLSRIDRALWTPQSGAVYYGLGECRFTFN